MTRRPHYMNFTTDSGGQYILDSNTGAVIGLNEIMQKAIDLYAAKDTQEVADELSKSYPEKEVKGVIRFLRRWTTQYRGLYRSDQLDKEVRRAMEGATEADYEKHIASGNITQLCLTVTENCNFRCKYCYLSETYAHTRNRSDNKMTLSTGIKALDMYFGYLKSVAKRNPGKVNAVTFYGGEPLMNLDLIKRLVDYTQAHCPTNYLVNLTTNGYLLTDDIVDYLVSSDIKVCVSLDGTKENHDRNRLLYNGKGTFDTVYGNIKRFQKRRHPHYLGLMLLPVYDYKTDLEANLRFFEENDLPITAFVNGVATANTQYFRRFTPEDLSKHNQQLHRLMEQYKELRQKGDKPPTYLTMLFSSLAVICFRLKGGDSKSYLTPYTGTCIPGHKIHVRTDGTLDICERVNMLFPIGHVDTGLDFAAIKRIMDLYNSSITKECDTCALNRICGICAASCNKEYSLCHETKCTNIRSRYKYDFGLHYSMYEKNPHAFDNLDLSHFEQMLLFK